MDTGNGAAYQNQGANPYAAQNPRAQEQKAYGGSPPQNPQFRQQRIIPPGFDARDVEEGRTLSIFPYVFNIAGVLLALIGKPDSKFCRFHANQALCLCVFDLICLLICIIPVLGWIVAGIGGVFSLVCVVIGVVNALKGNVKELPLIGKYQIL